MAKLKYFGSYLIPVLALITFYTTGIFAYFGIIFLYIIIPLIEQNIPRDTYNLNEVEKELAKEDVYYDIVIYVLVFLHLFVIYQFLTTISNPSLSTSDLFARIFMMGTVLGAVGINVGHELGHKINNPLKQIFAQLILTTSLQNHFMTYHNAGHHRDVATPEDLSSAKKGDNYYLFAVKSQIGGYFKTWKLEAKKLQLRKKSKLLNPMILYTILQLSLFAGIYYFFGTFVSLCYFVAAVYGISHLESQNYFSHYGLRRKKLENGWYEKVNEMHSWNSDHIIGRVLLFELTRHSDHHHHGSKDYQVLESKNNSPKLPYGYPAMLLLAYFPFIFKPIMAKQLKLYGIE